MGCGCKKKHEIPPAQQPAKITLTEGTGAKPPEPAHPIPPPPPPAVLDPSELVNKLQQILTPQ
jgi:hypothetical protein